VKEKRENYPQLSLRLPAASRDVANFTDPAGVTVGDARWIGAIVAIGEEAVAGLAAPGTSASFR